MGALAAWYLGPFAVLFWTDPLGGVAVLNRLLNHAALTRARALSRLDSIRTGLPEPEVSPNRIEFQITGVPVTYVGDEQVWYWYRGTGVGPYPCISALQALELACDQLIEHGTPIDRLVAVLLDGCENLAIPGLVVGILVRHLEIVGDLLDPYFANPLAWHLEFQRVVKEGSLLAANAEGIVASERRNWSFREAATVAALWADGDRVAELRSIGINLVENARLQIADARQAAGVEAQGDRVLAA